MGWGLIIISELTLRLSKNNHINKAIYLLLYISFYLQVMLYYTYHTSMLLYEILKEDMAFTKILKNCPSLEFCTIAERDQKMEGCFATSL